MLEAFFGPASVAVIIGNLSARGDLFLFDGVDRAAGATMVLTATTVFLLSALGSPRDD
jgi:hypothetical protein